MNSILEFGSSHGLPQVISEKTHNTVRVTKQSPTRDQTQISIFMSPNVCLITSNASQTCNAVRNNLRTSQKISKTEIQ